MSAPDSWELLITGTSRLDLERALERLLQRDAALLRAALDGGTPRVPRVHLRSKKLGVCCYQYDVKVDQVTDDPLAATCVLCKQY